MIAKSKTSYNRNASHVLQNERGGAALYALLGIAAISYYIYEGHRYFGEEIHSALYWAVIAILSVVTVFCMGCAVHMRLLGNKPNKELYRELLARIRLLEELVGDARRNLAEFEMTMVSRASIISRRGTDYLSLLKRITKAVELRLTEIKKLVNSRREVDLIEAYELFRKRLYVDDNCLEALIDSDPLPALEPHEWEPTISRLIMEIESELRNIEAVAA